MVVGTFSHTAVTIQRSRLRKFSPADFTGTASYDKDADTLLNLISDPYLDTCSEVINVMIELSLHAEEFRIRDRRRPFSSMRHTRFSRPLHGFTLVELLVVIAIIGILVALLLPAVQAAREAARRTQCVNNLHQIGVAVMHYESVNRRLPKGDWRQRTPSTGVDSLGTWVSLTLPYLEEANLYGKIDFSRPFFEQAEIGDSLQPHQVFFNTHICPSNGRVGLIMWNNEHYGARGNYAANAGWAGPDSGLWMNDVQWQQIGTEGRGHPENLTGVIFHAANGRPIHSAISGFGPLLINKGIALREATDGLSHTVAISEVRTVEGDDIRGSLHFGGGVLYLHSEVPNTAVQDFTRLCVSTLVAPCASTDETWRGYHKLSARSAHPGGVNVMLLDSSVQFVNDQINREAWKAVASFNGEELVNDSF